MSFFSMPPEVLWEMSMDLDLDDVEAVVNGYDGRLPSVGELESLRKFASVEDQFVSCSHCGTRNLAWLQTPNGPQLAYTNRWGNLRKKLHACPE